MPIPSITFTPTGGVQQVLAPPAPRPGNRLRGFTPDSIPIGPARPVLADGAIYGRRFRTDRLASFELPGLSADQLETAQALKVHLLNGGTATLATDDAADRSYTIRLAPDTVPQIRGPDSEFYEYTFAMTALNTAAASMVCTYGDAAVIWRADALNAFTRATAGSYHGGPSPLRIASVASGIPRVQHYQSGRRGLLVEPVRSNLLLRSGDPGNAAWSKDDVTIDAANPRMAPDGTLVGEIAEDAVNSVHEVFQVITIGDGATLAISGWFRANTRFRCLLGFSGGGSAVDVTWNADTLTLGTPAASGGAAVVRAYVDDEFADLGWYRIVLVGTLAGGVTSATVVFRLLDDSGASTYLGDITKGAYWWGMQADTGLGYAPSYVPTLASTVQYQSDQATLLLPFGPQPFWAYHRFIELGTIETSGGRAFQIGPNAGPGVIVFRNAGPPGRYAVRHLNGVLQTEVALDAFGAPAFFDEVELLIQLGDEGQPDIYQCINRGTVNAVVGGGTGIGFATAWGAGDVQIGSGGGGDFGAASHERLAIGRGSLGSGAARLMQKARSIAG